MDTINLGNFQGPQFTEAGAAQSSDQLSVGSFHPLEPTVLDLSDQSFQQVRDLAFYGRGCLPDIQIDMAQAALDSLRYGGFHLDWSNLRGSAVVLYVRLVTMPQGDATLMIDMKRNERAQYALLNIALRWQVSHATETLELQRAPSAANDQALLPYNDLPEGSSHQSLRDALPQIGVFGGHAQSQAALPSQCPVANMGAPGRRAIFSQKPNRVGSGAPERMPVTRRPRQPGEIEHIREMARLIGNDGVSFLHRMRISAFLCYLESNEQLLSQLHPDRSIKRPMSLQTAINQAILQHNIVPGTIAAFNSAFKLQMNPNRHIHPVPYSEANRKILEALPGFLRNDERKAISAVLGYLENEGLPVEPLLKKPVELSKKIEHMMKKYNLSRSTLGYFNNGLGLAWRLPGAKVHPITTQHFMLLKGLDDTLKNLRPSVSFNHKQNIRRFLRGLELEVDVNSFKELLLSSSRNRVVDEVVIKRGLSFDTSNSLNIAFDLDLPPPASGRSGF